MSIILAIETSTELASAALWRDQQCSTLETSGVQTHSASILPMVQKLLTEAGLRLNQCDAIAFGCGPGSFTGVRTACGVAQGLAFGAQLPVVPIVTLEAMAEACRVTSGATDVVAVLDARMQEAYWAHYRYDAGWQVVTEPTLSAPEAISVQAETIGCGNGFLAFADAFAGRPFALHANGTIIPHARYIAQLAQVAVTQGRTLQAEFAQPLYLRNHVAYTSAERAARAAGRLQGTS
ncbi:MAG: tRNA (adenosine(37)-N6)-threonylcarbamoyltransferase complex dimerization subunit type 1 TsaB [Herbaspirillum sp.]